MIPPTVITVNGVSATTPAPASAAPVSGIHHNLDSFLFNSMDEPTGSNNVVYNLDLEPIDFEHFVDEPDIGRNRFLINEKKFYILLFSLF